MRSTTGCDRCGGPLAPPDDPGFVGWELAPRDGKVEVVSGRCATLTDIAKRIAWERGVDPAATDSNGHGGYG
jgi:hypothetical protein